MLIEKKVIDFINQVDSNLAITDKALEKLVELG